MKSNSERCRMLSYSGTCALWLSLALGLIILMVVLTRPMHADAPRRLWLPLILRGWGTGAMPTPTPWCDSYEPNDDRRTNPWGPLQSGVPIQAKLCRGDPQDNYYFDTSTTNNIQIRLQLPGSLVNHTALWLYPANDLDHVLPNCGGGPLREADYRCECSLPHAGRYVVSLYTDGPSDDVNPYALQVTYQEAPTPTTPMPSLTVTPTSTATSTPVATATPTLSETEAPTRTPTGASPTSTATPSSGWVTIKEENFEGSFPNAWRLEGFDYKWGKRDCRAAGGSFSGWAVGGGSRGQSLACGSNYPDDVNSWMIYGPFSLADATAAEVLFSYWVYSENDWDTLFVGASTDGEWFYGPYASGDSSGWQNGRFDLTNVDTLGNLVGRSQVWVAFAFETDDSTNRQEGAFVDNIVLRKSATGSAGLAGPGPEE